MLKKCESSPPCYRTIGAHMTDRVGFKSLYLAQGQNCFNKNLTVMLSFSYAGKMCIRASKTSGLGDSICPIIY